MAVNTIFGYIATLVERGEAIDLSPYLSPAAREHIHTALKALAEPYLLQEVHRRTGERYTLDVIRLAVADYRRQRYGLK